MERDSRHATADTDPEHHEKLVMAKKQKHIDEHKWKYPSQYDDGKSLLDLGWN